MCFCCCSTDWAAKRNFNPTHRKRCYQQYIRIVHTTNIVSKWVTVSRHKKRVARLSRALVCQQCCDRDRICSSSTHVFLRQETQFSYSYVYAQDCTQQQYSQLLICVIKVPTSRERNCHKFCYKCLTTQSKMNWLSDKLHNYKYIETTIKLLCYMLSVYGELTVSSTKY